MVSDNQIFHEAWMNQITETLSKNKQCNYFTINTTVKQIIESIHVSCAIKMIAGKGLHSLPLKPMCSGEKSFWMAKEK